MSHPLRTSDFDYPLPPDRIAQTPVEPRDAARLLVLDRAAGSLSHHHFRDLPLFLRPGDLLIANDSRVRPARLLGHKLPSGGRVELLLLKPLDALTWETLARGRRLTPGTRLSLGDGQARAEIIGETEAGGRVVRFDDPIEPLLPQIGVIPLPPYIHTTLTDAERYQTVYSRVVGSAAAPTAGLHFTPELIQRLADLGVGFAFVTLHVGLDTFRPVEVEDARSHVMHSEWAELSAATAQAIAETKARGGRVVAVGTTAVRVLETAGLSPYAGWTRLFITPGYEFQVVDAMITNFHLPRSTLLLLVSAFASREAIRAAYATAIAENYRFFSFGDAMLIL